MKYRKDSLRSNMDTIYFRGYSTHLQFGDYKLPVPMQNILIRDYIYKLNYNNISVLLPVNEFYFQKSYLALENILKENTKLNGLVMCSVFMLPQKQSTRNKIINKFLNKGIQLHFRFENTKIENHIGIMNLDKKLLINDIANRSILNTDILK